MTLKSLQMTNQCNPGLVNSHAIYLYTQVTQQTMQSRFLENVTLYYRQESFADDALQHVYRSAPTSLGLLILLFVCSLLSCAVINVLAVGSVSESAAVAAG